jgi:histidyl-tRNA synthetase
MSQQLQTLKGFRDFLPTEKRLRDRVAAQIRYAFERFGFEPLETPTLEYAELLLGKYGDEADKLVYTFLDRGDRKIGLRYDQTVPTARVLAQYQNELPKYFRRYQIQNVFRADKPQKGRYREFTQCDADVFGSTSQLADAEILACVYNIFQAVGLSTAIITINDRQSLFAALTPFVTPEVSVLSIVQSIDKLDKQTPAEVVAELVAKGLVLEMAQKVVDQLEQSGISENLQAIITNTIALGVPADKLRFTPSLARGLDYYTGMIFEVRLPEYQFGSFGGGGRYDQLIESLGGPSVPAVGFGLGFDRMVEAIADKNIHPDITTSATQVLVTIFSQELSTDALQVAHQLRGAGITTEVSVSVDKIGKQFKLADQKNIPWVVVLGDEEKQSGGVQLKNMRTHSQQLVPLAEIVRHIQASS